MFNVRVLLTIFSACALVVIWFTSSTTAASNNVFYSLVQAAQQWQDANPDVCGQDTSSCGVQNMIWQFQACQAFRVVNGCPIGDQTVYGWQVGVVLGGALCSGTLISPTHIVCAAHCVKSIPANDPTRITVYIGPKSLRAASNVQKYTVSRFSAHPAYDPDLIANDASIIELSSPVSFSIPDGVRPACLPTRPVPRTLTALIIGGYGIDDYKKKTGAGTLRYTVVSVQPDSRCSALYGEDQYNETSTFCAIGQRANLPTDSCGGDSGSAVMSKTSSGRWNLVGIVSYGSAQCSAAPGVYADAFNCGVRASTAAIRRSKLDRNDDPCALRRDKLKRRPVGQHEKPVAGASGKKFGGVETSIAETIRVHGCKHHPECVSNVCREIEACRTVHGGPGSVLTRDDPDTELRALPLFTEVVQRPIKPINEAAAAELQPSLFRRRCSKVKVCWLPAWMNSFTTTPVFDFDTIVNDEDEEVEDAHKNGHKHKKP